MPLEKYLSIKIEKQICLPKESLGWWGPRTNQWRKESSYLASREEPSGCKRRNYPTSLLDCLPRLPSKSTLGALEIAFQFHPCKILADKILRLPKSWRNSDGVVVSLADAHGQGSKARSSNSTRYHMGPGGGTGWVPKYATTLVYAFLRRGGLSPTSQYRMTSCLTPVWEDLSDVFPNKVGFPKT